MSLERLLNDYASRVGLDSVPRGRDGAYSLVFDGRYRLRFIPEGTNTAIIHAVVATLPEDPLQREEMADRLLTAAVGRMRKDREVLSLADDGRSLQLHVRMAVDITPHAFSGLLTSFVNSLAFWKKLASTPVARLPPPGLGIAFR
jgi:Tir chaperone protein (CesT).